MSLGCRRPTGNWTLLSKPCNGQDDIDTSGNDAKNW